MHSLKMEALTRRFAPQLCPNLVAMQLQTKLEDGNTRIHYDTHRMRRFAI